MTHGSHGDLCRKHRPKQWYDSNVRSKEFTKGDLVLAFTLKKHKRNLKMRGLGSFVINEITSGGAVHLETLEGDPMTSFINEGCLKRFHEPLTPKMLDKLHAAKNRKLAQQ